MIEWLLPARRFQSCPVCGAEQISQKPVIWDDLAHAWELSTEEVDYIDQQQGEICVHCGCNLRSRTLAGALLDHLGSKTTLQTWVRWSGAVSRMRMLELNPAGSLSPYLQRLPRSLLACYPEVDMQHMPYEDASWDLVLHSDVLEHVADPRLALLECYRVLRPGGALIYTIPIVYGRMTRSRQGMPPSYHGDATMARQDWLVQTEYGADFWLQPMLAGFRKLTLYCLHGPQSLAIICCK